MTNRLIGLTAAPWRPKVASRASTQEEKRASGPNTRRHLRRAKANGCWQRNVAVGSTRYANNNPYKFADPDGRAAQCLVPGILQVCMAAVAKAAAVLGGATATKVTTGAAVATGVVAVGAMAVKSESGSGEATGSSEGGNTNPYDGPVEAPVIVVEGDGNAIPVAAGERIPSSPNGEFQQVRDADGNPTGTRLDKGGHPGQADPKARSPHAHRPGVTDETGNPHLPLNEPKQRQ